MQLTLKCTLFLVLLCAALLIALVGAAVRIGTLRVSPASHSHVHGAQLAWYCPAPPVTC